MKKTFTLRILTLRLVLEIYCRKFLHGQNDFATNKQIIVCVCHFYFFYFSVVHQDYSSEASNEYVIVGNDALMKCIVPSFVSDLVEIIAWTDTEENIFYRQSSGAWGTTILKSYVHA